MATRRRSPAGAPVKGRTRRPQFGQAVPRLPNERDESADGQAGGAPSAEQRQAYEDLRRGVVDTDRGPVLDSVYNERVKGEVTDPPSTKRRRRAR